LAVIDLRLFARLSLEPYRCGFLPTPAIAARLQQALHLLVTAAEPQRRQFPMQHHSVPVHFRPTLLDEFDIRIDRARPLAALPRLPAADSQPAPHRLAIHHQLPRDLSRAFAPLPPRHYLQHQIRAHHLPLRRSHRSRRKSYSFPVLFHALLLLGQVGEFQMIITGGDSHDC